MRKNSLQHEHAVVVGAGIAGLCAAAALATRFVRVTVVDRDDIAPDSWFRRGVPQGHHAHYLLERGAMAMEDLFPGLRAEIKAAGVPVHDFGIVARFLLPTGWSPLHETGITIQPLSRPYLETFLRRRALALDNVTLLTDFHVDGLNLARSHKGPHHVRGIRGRHNGQAVDLTANLVVETTGRGSRLPRWLTEHGLPAPREREISARVVYASRIYHGHPDSGPLIQGALVYAPTRRRGGAVLGMENDTGLVILAGADGELCPTDEEGFAAYATTLPTPVVRDYLSAHEPCGPIHRTTNLSNRWRLLHRYPKWPHGLIALGDSVCYFNPIYAQGMTVAALQAAALPGWLDGHTTTRIFQHKLARIIRTPWLMATSADLAWAPRQAGATARAAHWYLDRLMPHLPAKPDLYRRFASVQHMRRSPATLLAPSVLRTVLGPAAPPLCP
ncbi:MULTISPECIES: FAD-dependent oxidoreductase [unclassified Streptomyces]|uniref:FAD-dependent oxidoreductase n=1 Tax=unclassified Streptomyces TaxID=2593676 RepID=UPI000823E8CC|nr:MULTISPECIES: FAD-dependent oxidoreductase [unclassified Streptomyces]MYU01450.1 FAD-dependent oxidoreductase [Streptomyces sp. SID8350]SCK63361.1 2-polyprenyl-6-methoxyphenol hydroxylase [Streptomyces sp. AmelKG-D3]